MSVRLVSNCYQVAVAVVHGAIGCLYGCLKGFMGWLQACFAMHIGVCKVGIKLLAGGCWSGSWGYRVAIWLH